MQKITLLECQKMAEKEGYDHATFDLCGKSGKLKCQWLDAYLGIFKPEGIEKNGFVMVNQFLGQDVWCENFQVPNLENNEKITCHKDGTITFWSVYEQRWYKKAKNVSDKELLAMPEKKRNRAMKHVRRKK